MRTICHMTVDKFGRHIHHHGAEADQIYLVKEFDLKTLKCASVTHFSLQPGKFLQFDGLDYLRLLIPGHIRALVLEGYTENFYYFLNGKVFTRLEQLYQEPITPHSCLQIRSGSTQSPIAGYVVIEYTPWHESPFSDFSRQVLTFEETEVLIGQ